jgi:phosphopentomutase
MIQNDLSLSTILISSVSVGAIGLVGWALKETAKTLISTLIKTMARVEMLDGKIADILKQTGAFPKMQQDLNEYYKRLKEIEDKLSKEAGL